ncbi:MAG TPA: alanine racemase [Selenomonadales bacterium]|nr:alanine racemase [Selenomonadales bacterium]
MRPTFAEIDLAAIRHNIREIRSAIGPGVKLTAVVKANAYGHGAVPVSRTALEAGADCLAVAIPEEGAELRAAGVSVPIFILGLTLPDQAGLVADNDLTASVSTQESVTALAEAGRRLNRSVKVMLKVDTGMHRIGVSPGKAEEFLQLIAATPGVEAAGIFTHLAAADAADKAYAIRQLTQFRAVAEKPSSAKLEFLSAANSATVVDLSDGYFNMVRPGIILYGLPPSGEMHKTLDLRPAMQFKTRITYIKQVPAGSPVSYGCTYRAERETYLATLPVGYADGYSRHLSNKGEVLIGGRRRPVVGRVCMDQTIVDLGPVCDAAVGDEAVLFGRQGNAEITVTELADLTGTINYELVCRVSARVPRVYVHQ